MTDQQAAEPPSSRRIRKTIAGELAPSPTPGQAPSEQELSEGHLAVGMIDDAVAENPGQDVQGPDTLIISTDIPRHGTIHREVSCPLPRPGSGRSLVGQSIRFRHSTLDPDFRQDILVVRWPRKAQEALEPVRYDGPGVVRTRIWILLAGCGFVIMWAGIVLTLLLLCGIVFGGDIFTDLPTWFHPGIALAASIVAIPIGMFSTAVCIKRKEKTLTHSVNRKDGR